MKIYFQANFSHLYPPVPYNCFLFRDSLIRRLCSSVNLRPFDDLDIFNFASSVWCHPVRALLLAIIFAKCSGVICLFLCAMDIFLLCSSEKCLPKFDFTLGLAAIFLLVSSEITCPRSDADIFALVSAVAGGLFCCARDIFIRACSVCFLPILAIVVFIICSFVLVLPFNACDIFAFASALIFVPNVVPPPVVRLYPNLMLLYSTISFCSFKSALCLSCTSNKIINEKLCLPYFRIAQHNALLYPLCTLAKCSYHRRFPLTDWPMYTLPFTLFTILYK